MDRKQDEWEPLIAQMINGSNAYPDESVFLLGVPDAAIEAAIASFGFDWRIAPSVPVNKVLLVEKPEPPPMTTPDVRGRAERDGIRLIRSHVVTCYSCGAWLGRAPLYYSEGDKGDQCHKCGSTGVRVREGRPFGPKSKDWEWLADEAIELMDALKDDRYAMQELREAIVLEEPQV